METRVSFIVLLSLHRARIVRDATHHVITALTLRGCVSFSSVVSREEHVRLRDYRPLRIIVRRAIEPMGGSDLDLTT